ncbi:MAG: hypothetical protein ACLT38_01905 [Akkermansia sp.]
MMAGYTLNLPIGDYTMFYLGGKVGATYGDVKTTIHGLEDGSRSRTISSTKFSWLPRPASSSASPIARTSCSATNITRFRATMTPATTPSSWASPEFLTNNYQVYYGLPAAPLYCGTAFLRMEYRPAQQQETKGRKADTHL